MEKQYINTGGFSECLLEYVDIIDTLYRLVQYSLLPLHDTA